MASAHHLYRRTEAGKIAWQSQDARLPLEYRRVLGVMEGDMHPDYLRARLPHYSPDETVHLLNELAERGLVEAVEAKEHHDLDFTGEFSIPDLKKPGR